jgi:serine/threonine protein kinase
MKANILVDDNGRCCLADFGLGTIIANTKSMADNADASGFPGGSIRWMAPEFFRTDPAPSKPSQETDIYALGCTIIEVIQSFSTTK